MISGEIHEELGFAVRYGALEEQFRRLMQKAHAADMWGQREEEIDALKEALHTRSAQLELWKNV